MPMSVRRLAVLLAALVAFSATACGRDAGTGKLRIATAFDQPGLSMQNPDGSMSGFDIDVAGFVANQLGYPDEQIEWLQVSTAKRESVIAAEPGGRLACTGSSCRRAADMVVASYSITAERRAKVDFAGPYLVTGQRILVRADNTDITGPGSLQKGRKVCSVEGSTSARRIRDEYPSAALQLEDTYPACMDALRAGTVDAVSTDEAILAGYAAHSQGIFKLVGEPFSEERYGIGLARGDDRLRGKINDALRKMEADGAWKAAFEKNLGPAGLPVPAPPAIDRH